MLKELPSLGTATIITSRIISTSESRIPRPKKFQASKFGKQRAAPLMAKFAKAAEHSTWRGRLLKVTWAEGGLECSAAQWKSIAGFLTRGRLLGRLRFRPPEALKSWDGILDATTRRTACPQVAISPLLDSGVVYTEDCLHLNVWTPAARYRTPAPVLVVIHGGGFSQGSAGVEVFNGAILAARTGFVVVSFNYRLGILGFLDANSTDAPGNVGLMDQNLALQWIQEHIHNFRGDPSKVTIVGVNAGGISAHAHVISPMSRGLFQRACLMSGTFNSPDFVDHASDSVRKGNVVARAVGCADGNTTLASNPVSVLACLRSKSSDKLVHAATESFKPKIFPFLPTYPNQFMPKDPALAVREGLFNPADLIVGGTTDEGAMALLYPHREELLLEKVEGLDEKGFDRSLRETISSWLKNNSSKNLATYTAKARDKAALRRAYVDYLSDRTFVCPKHFTAEGHSKHGRSVYTYVFAYRSADSLLPTWMGTPHGWDLAYIFGLPLIQRKRYDLNDAAMSDVFMMMFSTFASTGVPQLPMGKQWPKYSADNPVSVYFDKENITSVVGFRKQYCNVWTPDAQN
ncbi:LOW QUALITY PROTEIN: cholinesterase 1-like [Rhipicephalus sanguineus]|uniref:LOW QUALITY PROTEIN: cholinesterase 1-like n=1 Tax=Rhipicephalus sanguineus TaxID=34632 RepID=UPI0020C2D44A|nr:LOW QUALITY PROTEIN: cholinesterase 1-like [Rhipicephalus sanguineus]